LTVSTFSVSRQPATSASGSHTYCGERRNTGSTQRAAWAMRSSDRRWLGRAASTSSRRSDIGRIAASSMARSTISTPSR